MDITDIILLVILAVLVRREFAGSDWYQSRKRNTRRTFRNFMNKE